jgi:hypothetical protein
MKERVYKRVRLVGCSSESIERAVALALAKAGETVRGMSWFEVVEIRGAVADGAPAEWQVTIEVGFKVD